ncbi:MAG: hypothetical protein K2O04_05440 [Clostridiales bacterium]|nr:hypothetical protein [Clostridiales bacterium]
MEKCKACNYCKMLYTKCGVKYWREKKLYCALYEKLVGRDGGCETWQAQKTEYDLSSQRFDSVEEDINILLNMFIML